jgi:putative ATP-binding cassette transporter
MKIPKWKINIVIIVILTLVECALVGYIGVWREGFWNSVETRNLNVFGWYLGYFIIAALFACLCSGYNTYIQNYTSLIFRTKLTRKAWLIEKNKTVTMEGYQQRIQEDCFYFPQLVIGLVTNLFKTSLTVIIYIGLLIYQLNIYYLLIPLIYVTIGTLVAAKLARPLINLNYINQVFEARFRQILSRLNYAKVYRNNYNLFKTTKNLSYFQYFYNQISVVVPYVILFPIYFSAAITFGVFMQCAKSMEVIVDGLSFLINSFNDINKMLSCRRRLKEYGVLK